MSKETKIKDYTQQVKSKITSIREKNNKESRKNADYYYIIIRTSTGGEYVEEFRECKLADELYEWCVTKGDYNEERHLKVSEFASEKTVIIRRGDVVEVEKKWYSVNEGVIETFISIFTHVEVPIKMNFWIQSFIVIVYSFLVGILLDAGGHLGGIDLGDIEQIINNVDIITELKAVLGLIIVISVIGFIINIVGVLKSGKLTKKGILNVTEEPKIDSKNSLVTYIVRSILMYLLTYLIYYEVMIIYIKMGI